jgi:hypothetical protein
MTWEENLSSRIPCINIGYGNVFINSDCDGAENVENEEI